MLMSDLSRSMDEKPNLVSHAEYCPLQCPMGTSASAYAVDLICYTIRIEGERFTFFSMDN